MAATGCASNEFTRLGVPEPITEQADRVLALWQGSWIAAFAVGILVWGLIIWSVVFHRKRSEKLPPQVRYNMPIEALYTVLPIVIISVLFYFTARDQTYLMETDEPADVNIEVVGFQWSWQFKYLDEKGPDGQPLTVEGVPGEDPVLVIPNDTVVHFDLESPDVIHSFWIPAFLFKMDVIPNQPNEFQVKVKDGVEGEFAGRCAEMCGVDHSRMLFTVEVVEPADYEARINELRQQAQEAPAPEVPETEGAGNGTQDEDAANGPQGTQDGDAGNGTRQDEDAQSGPAATEKAGQS